MSDDEIAKTKEQLNIAIFQPLCKKWKTENLGKFKIPSNRLQAWCFTEESKQLVYSLAGLVVFAAAIVGPWGALAAIIPFVLFGLYRTAVTYLWLGTTLKHQSEIKGYAHPKLTGKHIIERYGTHTDYWFSCDMERILNKGVTVSDVTNALNRQYQTQQKAQKARIAKLTDAIVEADVLNNADIEKSSTLAMYEELQAAKAELKEAGILDLEHIGNATKAYLNRTAENDSY